MRRALSSLIGGAALAMGIAVTAAAQEPAGQEPATAQPEHFPMLTAPRLAWPFSGLFGTFNQAQLQRGFEVYRVVCSTCHSMKLVAFRHLADPGGPHFSEAAVRALAARYPVTDGPNDNGEMFARAGRPYDILPSPFPNPQAAAAAFGGAAPPDLSVIAKARGNSQGVLRGVADFFTLYQEGGADYIHALLTGFQDPPAGIEVPEGTFYNPYFASAVSLRMPPPLTDGLVTYADDAPETVDQYARDVAAFLMWTAEPKLVARKRLGFEVLVYLLVFASLMYVTKQRVWASVHSSRTGAIRQP
jgi:ubiquinol-cytochrome c reductase cytochrome c1 subunit